MLTVNSNVTLVLGNNIILQGHSQNTGSLVYVNGGIFKMNNGATITGNSGKSGVYLNSGTFEMNGGTISDNTAGAGGGVYLSSSTTFNMSGGTITGNSASSGGGGVCNFMGTLIMSGGIISGNTASSGGGVYRNHGTFEMSGGTISGNSANEGGGVWCNGAGYFTMRGGTITSNIAVEYGGGVHFHGYSSFSDAFTKTGGIITGYSSDPSSGNVVHDGFRVLELRGHAIYSDYRRKETTSGQLNNLYSSSSSGWD